jgi:fumarate hydratase class II
MMPLIARNLLEEIELLAAAVDNFRAKLLSGLEVDRERVAALNERSLALATGLVPLLGYDRAAAIVKEAWSTNRTIREVALARGVASAEDLDRLLDLRAQTEPRRGGSGRGAIGRPSGTSHPPVNDSRSSRR